MWLCVYKVWNKKYVSEITETFTDDMERRECLCIALDHEKSTDSSFKDACQ